MIVDDGRSCDDHTVMPTTSAIDLLLEQQQCGSEIWTGTVRTEFHLLFSHRAAAVVVAVVVSSILIAHAGHASEHRHVGGSSRGGEVVVDGDEV